MSLGDFFDNVVPKEWREEAWAVIKNTPRLRWQIVTKRLPLVRKMLPEDWNGGRGYEHVGIIATVVDQDELVRDLPRLVALKSIGVRWIGLSIEPQLGLVTLANHPDAKKLDWIIGGGESKQGHEEPRPYYMWWAEVLIAECHRLGIPYFQKQVGSLAFLKPEKRLRTKHPRGEDPTEWPPHIRVRQMPRIYDEVAR